MKKQASRQVINYIRRLSTRRGLASTYKRLKEERKEGKISLSVYREYLSEIKEREKELKEKKIEKVKKEKPEIKLRHEKYSKKDIESLKAIARKYKSGDDFIESIRRPAVLKGQDPEQVAFYKKQTEDIPINKLGSKSIGILTKWDIEVNKNFREDFGKKYPKRGWFAVAEDFHKMVRKGKITKKEFDEAQKVKEADKIFQVKDYTPYERMNMLRTGARITRLKELYNAKKDGYKKVQIGSRVIGIDTAIKNVELQASMPEKDEALKVKFKRSKKEIRSDIYNIIKELEASRSDGYAKEYEILVLAEDKGISKGEAKKAVSGLLSSGDIFEPKSGQYQRVITDPKFQLGVMGKKVKEDVLSRYPKEDPQSVVVVKKAFENINDVKVLKNLRNVYLERYEKTLLHPSDYVKIDALYEERLKEIKGPVRKKPIKTINVHTPKDIENVILKLLDVKSKESKYYKSIPSSTKEFVEEYKDYKGNKDVEGVRGKVIVEKSHIMGVSDRKNLPWSVLHGGGYQKQGHRVNKIEVFPGQDDKDGAVRLVNEKGNESFYSESFFADVLKMSGSNAKLYTGDQTPLVSDPSYKGSHIIVLAPKVTEDEGIEDLEKRKSYFIDYKQREVGKGDPYR